jgi:A/G-specific adenine glycosylase
MATEWSAALLQWFDLHGRHDLPWQHPRSAYRVWVSEVMLQQTQVATVIGYFDRWMARFPDVRTLADAPLDEVLALWSGLGYYARARNLKRAAELIVENFTGTPPAAYEDWLTLPGVGASTAAAIVAQAFGARAAVLDGNVKRVLARHTGLDEPIDSSAGHAALKAIAEARLPQLRLADYTQAIMDLGATVCTARSPDCASCPVRSSCHARSTDRVASLPVKRPKRTRGEKSVQLLVIENGNRVWLESRPTRGIWGGLRSLKELPIEADPLAWCRTQFQSTGRKLKSPAPFRHAFTHYELHATPVRIAIDGPQAGSEWVAPDDIESLPLPTPIRTLLRTLYGARPTQEPAP